MINTWQEVHGVVTPGGDTCWCCPICFGGEHVYGIENWEEAKHECPDCKVELVYPWEVEPEETINDLIRYLDHYSIYPAYQSAWEAVKKYYGIE